MKTTREDREAALELVAPHLRHTQPADASAWLSGGTCLGLWDLGLDLHRTAIALGKARAEGAAAALADPKLVLPAAEKLLREAGIVRALLLGPPDDHQPFVELGDAIRGQDDTMGVVANTLYVGWQLASSHREHARKREEGRRG